MVGEELILGDAKRLMLVVDNSVNRYPSDLRPKLVERARLKLPVQRRLGRIEEVGSKTPTPRPPSKKKP